MIRLETDYQYQDVEQLRTVLTTRGLMARNPLLDAATQDQIDALRGYRLHRAP